MQPVVQRHSEELDKSSHKLNRRGFAVHVPVDWESNPSSAASIVRRVSTTDRHM
jgi:hypothetical protein